MRYALGFKGGIYNPGAVVDKDGQVILLARGQVCHWYDAVGTKADLFYQGDPVGFELDESLNITSSHVINSVK